MHVLWEDNKCLTQQYIKWVCSEVGRHRRYQNVYIKAQQISLSALGFPLKVTRNWQLFCVRSWLCCPETEPKSRQGALWVKRMSWLTTHASLTLLSISKPLTSFVLVLKWREMLLLSFTSFCWIRNVSSKPTSCLEKKFAIFQSLAQFCKSAHRNAIFVCKTLDWDPFFSSITPFQACRELERAGQEDWSPSPYFRSWNLQFVPLFKGQCLVAASSSSDACLCSPYSSLWAMENWIGHHSRA